MVVDAVKEILVRLGMVSGRDKICPNGDEYKYFKKYCQGEPLNLSESACPTDDKFFEYFRSLAFAHPFRTDRPKFFKQGEIQYSPWVIANDNRIAAINMVGLCIYTNKKANTKTSVMNLLIPFETLKMYIASRYIQLHQAILWANEKIEFVHGKWKKQKINRNQKPLEILEEIKSIMITRHWDYNDVDLAIDYLTCPLTCIENKKQVETYRSEIIRITPDFCNAIEELDGNLAFQILDEILEIRPHHLYSEANYSLSKIFANLTDDNSADTMFGLQQASEFNNRFAKKWVNIKPYEMSFTEIKLLIRTACYLASLEEKI